MAKISIIIPIYNGERYLKECLDSLVHQTLKDIEIICINDGSKDGTINILENYRQVDSRVSVIDIPNGGQSAARNLGMTLAKGEYLSFIDCDDKVDIDFFEKLYNAAEFNSADIGMASVYRLRQKKNRYFLHVKENKVCITVEEKYAASNLPKSCYVWNKIYKREALINNGIQFRVGVRYEDIEFTHKALNLLGKMVTVSGPKYYYRDNVESIVNTFEARKDKDYWAAMDFAVDYVTENKINYDLFRYPPREKKMMKFLGIPLIRVKSWDFGKKYYLLNILPIKVIFKKGENDENID